VHFRIAKESFEAIWNRLSHQPGFIVNSEKQDLYLGLAALAMGLEELEKKVEQALAQQQT
jgi:hypothetical protein